MKTIQPALTSDTGVRTLQEAIADYPDHEIYLAGSIEFEMSIRFYLMVVMLQLILRDLLVHSS